MGPTRPRFRHERALRQGRQGDPQGPAVDLQPRRQRVGARRLWLDARPISPGYRIPLMSPEKHKTN